ELLQYAIFAAEEGFVLSPRLHAVLESERFLRHDPAARLIYFDQEGKPKPPGTRLVNRAYGATLRTLALEGVGAFYRGPIAAEVGRLAYADRARYLGDPDFVPVPVRKLLDGKYLDRRARLIGERAMREAAPGDTEANGTTHFSIADAQGNVVAMSSTIENPFGSRI